MEITLPMLLSDPQLLNTFVLKALLQKGQRYGFSIWKKGTMIQANAGVKNEANSVEKNIKSQMARKLVQGILRDLALIFFYINPKLVFYTIFSLLGV